ncbi:MAG: hypothetical protein D5R97_09135 [Candidatus Syntrophonatronum acetioxidans]|uniref:Uncharacterized protein n=1 Tax=Candidatus Syntrophonatronum acetioxidans TaxID=1795816 RepID=A0A424YAI8_9FIRM|nr:MAG: hypothetical protein D5R97_09135 [Candidatus Syntrophonatronum acetioxidans]
MWIDDYVKLHFPVNPEDMCIEEAQIFKYKHLPASLYRYREFNKYNIENLFKEQEWQSYPSEFNDPFDSRIKIGYEKVKNDYFFTNTFEEFINMIKEQGFSFTKEDINGYTFIR